MREALRAMREDKRRSASSGRINRIRWCRSSRPYRGADHNASRAIAARSSSRSSRRSTSRSRNVCRSTSFLDNYATHKHPNVQAWLKTHPRFHLHFTPTSSSWLNMIEIFFGRLTDKAIRRGIFHNVPSLIDAIETYLATHNENPKPFVWTASTDQILEKIRRGRVTLETIAH